MGNGRVLSGQSLTVPLCCIFPLTLFPCPSTGPSHGLQRGLSPGCSSFSKYQAAPVWHLLTGKSLLHCGLHRPQGNLLWCLSTSSSSFNLCVPSAVSCSFCFLLLLYLCAFFFCPFLNMFSQMRHYLGCPLRVRGADWNQLCPSQGSPSLSSQRLVLQPPHCQHLDTNTQYTHQHNSCSLQDTKWVETATRSTYYAFQCPP